MGSSDARLMSSIAPCARGALKDSLKPHYIYSTHTAHHIAACTHCPTTTTATKITITIRIMSSQEPTKPSAGNMAQTHQTTIGCGTNSPPVEASCSGRPMGLADIDGTIDAGFVPDREQRKGTSSLGLMLVFQSLMEHVCAQSTSTTRRRRAHRKASGTWGRAWRTRWTRKLRAWQTD